MVMTIQEENAFIKKHLSETPPEPCEFKVGDIVTFTNCYGVSFPGRKIIGFAKKGESWRKDCFVHLNNGAYWFGNSPNSLTKEAAV